MHWLPLPADMQPDPDQLMRIEDDGDLTRHEDDDDPPAVVPNVPTTLPPGLGAAL